MSRSLLVLGGVLLLLGLSGVFVPSEGVAQELSAEGRFVVFDSKSSRLVPGDTNGSRDVFVRDRSTGTTERVSVSGKEKQGIAVNGSDYGAPSADGRYVAFTSDASNLVPGDTNRESDIFVRDRIAGTTRRVSVSSEGVQANDGSFDSAISANGRYVAFTSWASNLVPGDTNRVEDVFVHDRITGTTERVSITDREVQAKRQDWTYDYSHAPSLSANGRYVAFVSGANLVPGDTNQHGDVFVRDRAVGTTERVSVSTSGEQGNADSGGTHWEFGETRRLGLSADGRFVAFYSSASNLVPGDTNQNGDVFVRDRAEGTTERISVSTSGEQGDETSGDWLGLSADGRFVAFYSSAQTLVSGDSNGAADVFVRDRAVGTTERISVPGESRGRELSPDGGGLSADGRYVVFRSQRASWVEWSRITHGFENVFVRDRLRGTTERMSLTTQAPVDAAPLGQPSDKGTPQTLPYTGLPLLVIAAFGVLLAVGGLVLRRLGSSDKAAPQLWTRKP